MNGQLPMDDIYYDTMIAIPTKFLYSAYFKMLTSHRDGFLNYISQELQRICYNYEYEFRVYNLT